MSAKLLYNQNILHRKWSRVIPSLCSEFSKGKLETIPVAHINRWLAARCVSHIFIPLCVLWCLAMEFFFWFVLLSCSPHLLVHFFIYVSKQNRNSHMHLVGFLVYERARWETVRLYCWYHNEYLSMRFPLRFQCVPAYVSRWTNEWNSMPPTENRGLMSMLVS